VISSSEVHISGQISVPEYLSCGLDFGGLPRMLNYLILAKSVAKIPTADCIVLYFTCSIITLIIFLVHDVII
jgi:hypothetical protein